MSSEKIARDLLNIDEAASYLGVTKRSMRNLIEQRAFAIYKVGHLIRIDANVLNDYLDANLRPARGDRRA